MGINIGWMGEYPVSQDDFEQDFIDYILEDKFGELAELINRYGGEYSKKMLDYVGRDVFNMALLSNSFCDKPSSAMFAYFWGKNSSDIKSIISDAYDEVLFIPNSCVCSFCTEYAIKNSCFNCDKNMRQTEADFAIILNREWSDVYFIEIGENEHDELMLLNKCVELIRFSDEEVISNPQNCVDRVVKLILNNHGTTDTRNPYVLKIIDSLNYRLNNKNKEVF